MYRGFDRLVGVYTNLSAGRVIFDFLGTCLSGEAQAGHETTDVAWFAKKDTGHKICQPGYLRRLQQMLSFDGRI